MKLSELVFETKVTLVEEKKTGIQISRLLPLENSQGQTVWRLIVSDAATKGKTGPLAYADFTDEKTAKAVVKKLSNDKGLTASNVITRLDAVSKRFPNKMSLKKLSPIAQLRKASLFKTFEDVEEYAKKSRGAISKMVSSGGWWLFKALNSVGFVTAIYFGIWSAIAEIEQDPSISADEKQEKINILWGMFAAESALTLALVMKSGKIAAKLIKQVRKKSFAARAGAGAAAGLAGGPAAPLTSTLGALFTLAATEIGFLLVQQKLADPSFQQAIADILYDTGVGTILGAVGMVVGPVAQGAAGIIDEAIGDTALGQAVKEFFGFDEEQTRGGREGDYYASTDWAKLTFAHLIFPEASKAQLVPYIPPGRRESLLQKQLKLINEDNTVPSASSEPGLPENPDAPTQPQ